jgi:MarR family transcriptional regulator, transcriptional regulator for hemolysin
MTAKRCSTVIREGIDGFGITLHETTRALHNKIDERLRPLGLSKATWSVVGTLSCNQDPMSQRELADALSVEGPTLVRLLDRLEALGWVKRVALASDRRVKQIFLTPKAEPFLDELVAAALGVEEEMARGIPLEDIRVAHRVLLAMRDNLSSVTGPSANALHERS